MTMYVILVLITVATIGIIFYGAARKKKQYPRVNIRHLLSKKGEVIHTIPRNGSGKVFITRKEKPNQFNARSSMMQEILQGTPVVIVESV